MANRNTRQTAATRVDAPQVDPQPQEDQNVATEDTATAAVPMTHDGEPGVDHPVSGADPSQVEKKTVKTTGKFLLQDPWTGTIIDENSDGTEVVVTSFIRNRLENGDLEEA
jgi:hypothetical protein